MLRHYDAIGLLEPDAVDPASGYRSYSPEQLRDLNRIVALKELGISRPARVVASRPESSETAVFSEVSGGEEARVGGMTAQSFLRRCTSEDPTTGTSSQRKISAYPCRS